MSLKRWRDKVDRYVEYANSGRYEERFGMKRFRVLVITTTAKRLANLESAVAGRTDSMFWMAVLPEVTADGVLSAVWRRHGSAERRGLLPAEMVPVQQSD